MINLGISGAGKWYSSDCVPKEVMVVENRYVITQPHMINNFWNVFRYCRDHKIGQIITIDLWQPSGHYSPPEKELRTVVSHIKNALISNGMDRDINYIAHDNEPAKYGVPMGLYCWQANVIHDELDGSYDLYVGGDEVSYRNWYQNIVPNCLNEGIAFHLQNCALSVTDTDASINFISSLAGKYQKKVTCSEGNYGDPSNQHIYNLIKYHIKRCRDIGALDYCVIFLELKGHSKYKWLSFKYDNIIRSPHYQDYINLCIEEKNKQDIKELEDMKLEVLKVGSKGNQVLWLQEILELEYNFENEGGFDGIFGPKTESQVKAYQQANGLKVDGLVGKKTMTDLIIKSDIPDEWMTRLQIYMAYE